MTGFVETSPTADAYWRSIILFGSNSATYKFALGKALLELAAGDQTFISLEDLAKPYTRSLVEHLRRTDRQGTAASSQFLSACRNFTRGEITEGELGMDAFAIQRLLIRWGPAEELRAVI